MSFFNKTIKKSYAPAKPKGKQTHNKGGAQVAYPPQLLSIRLHADGSVINGLTVDDVLNGERDVSVFKKLADKAGALGVLTQGGGVHFIVAKTGKKWFVKYNEFSFIINHRYVKPQPKAPEPVALQKAA